MNAQPSSLDATPRKLLHVGCGPNSKRDTTPAFDTPLWQEIRLDINPDVQPDVVGTMLDMQAVPDASIDAIYSSHNIEHLYPHDVPRALSEFLRVLKPDGFAVITCPDLQAAAALIAEDKLTDAAYQSPAGPIAPIDMLYGHRPDMARGNLYMAHRCGFTERVLVGTLLAASFASVISMRRQPYFDLWALCTKQGVPEAELRALAGNYLPR